LRFPLDFPMSRPRRVMFAYHLVGYSNRVKNDCDSLFAHLARFNFAAIAELHANCKFNLLFLEKVLNLLGNGNTSWTSRNLDY